VNRAPEQQILGRDDLFTAPQVAALLPFTATSRTVNNWATDGKYGIVLESITVFSKRYFARDKVEQFLRDVTEEIKRRKFEHVDSLDDLFPPEAPAPAPIVSPPPPPLAADAARQQS
jgi:hypothetical protein